MVRIILAIGILLAIAFLAVEIRGWSAGTKILTGRQKALRVASALLMIALMVMVLVGDRWLAPYDPLITVAYWTVCFGLAVGLLLLALLDFKEVGLGYGKERKRILRNLAQRREQDTNEE